MGNNELVLIVEDEPKIAALLRDYLAQSGYRTHWLGSGDEAGDWVRASKPDLVLLDLMLPGKDGLTVCREIRSFSEVPIIMITAKVDEIDRIIGLELGADDYVCKPFSPREVVARAQAILRRIGSTQVETAATYRGIRIDKDRVQATINGSPTDLTPVEFRLLEMLVAQPGRVFSRDQLMNQIYVDGRIVSDRTVDSHIKNLRQKIEPMVNGEELIWSIYGVGYKLE